MAYNFDFSYLKNGAPAVTLSSFGIAFNKGAIESLGTPDQVIIRISRPSASAPEAKTPLHRATILRRV